MNKTFSHCCEITQTKETHVCAFASFYASKKENSRVAMKQCEIFGSLVSKPSVNCISWFSSRARLKNVDRSTATYHSVTVNDFTVVITEFKPKAKKEKPPKKEKGGGGVGFYVREDIEFKIIDSPFYESRFETICVDVYLSKYKVTRLLNLYIPPGTKLHETLDLLDRLPLKKNNCFVFGDFNYNQRNPSNKELARDFTGLGPEKPD